MTLIAAILSSADGGSECVDLPAGNTMRMRACPPYLLALSDLPDVTSGQPVLHEFFTGIIAGFGAPTRDFETAQLTMKGKKLPALRTNLEGLDAKYDATAVSTLVPGTKRTRMLACLADTSRGGTRANCNKRLEALNAEPALPVATALMIDGKAVASPAGCKFEDPVMLCEGHQLTMLVGMPPGDSREAIAAELARATGEFAKRLGSNVEVQPIGCTRTKQHPVCHLATLRDHDGEAAFVATTLFFRAEGPTFAVCTTNDDPRVKMPAACALVMKFEAAK